MTREMKVEAMVVRAIDEGYEFLGKGTGSYDEALASNRAKGYDVRCWYTSITRAGREWTMYGKKKESKRSSKKAVFTTNSVTGQTYYHGFQDTKSSDEIRDELESQTVKTLREYCKLNTITGYAKMNKQQMIDAILNHMK